MKDYLLSEIKEYCKQRCVKFAKPYKNETKLLSPCKKCEMLETICKETLPVGWEIEQRDMIELPCRTVYLVCDEGTPYAIVLSKPIEDLKIYEVQNLAKHGYFTTRAEAEAFLEKSKEDKK